MTLALVTGATGQLGSHIVEQLRAAGTRVRALVRPGSNSTWLQGQGVELCEGDLRDAAKLREAVRGADVVYNCAAKVSDWGRWRDFEEEARTGATNLVAACRAESLPRLLHVSSISVYGHPKLRPGELITEETPLGQHFWLWDYYPRAKLLAENLVREFPATTVVRPSWIYGPRDRVTIPRVVRALLEGRVPIIGSGDNFLNIIYAGDVAAGAIRAANHPGGAGQAYNLSSHGEVRQRDLLNTLCSALQIPPVTRRVPFGLVLQFAFAQEALGKLLGRKTPPTITRRAVFLVGRSTQYSTAKAKSELNWEPLVKIDEGVARTLEWFFAQPENQSILRKLPK